MFFYLFDYLFIFFNCHAAVGGISFWISEVPVGEGQVLVGVDV